MADFSVAGVVGWVGDRLDWLREAAGAVLSGDWQPADLDALFGWVARGASIGLALMVVFYSIRWRVEAREIPKRQQTVVIPSTEFAPTKDEMSQMIAALQSQVHRASGGWWFRRVGFARFSVTATADGKLGSWVTVPSWARGAIFAGYGSHKDLSLRPPVEVPLPDYLGRPKGSRPPGRVAGWFWVLWRKVTRRPVAPLVEAPEASPADELLAAAVTELERRREEDDSPAESSGAEDGGWADVSLDEIAAATGLEGKGKKKRPATKGDDPASPLPDDRGAPAPAGDNPAERAAAIDAGLSSMSLADLQRMSDALLGEVFATDAAPSTEAEVERRGPDDGTDRAQAAIERGEVIDPNARPEPGFKPPAPFAPRIGDTASHQVQSTKPGGRFTVRMEFKPTGSPAAAFVTWRTPDPKGMVARVVSQLDGELHESLELVVDVRPVPEARRDRVLRKAVKQWAKENGSPGAGGGTATAMWGGPLTSATSAPSTAARPSFGSQMLGGFLGQPVKSGSGSRALLTDDMEADRVAKLAELSEVRVWLLNGEPMFDVQLFIVASSDIKGRAVQFAKQASAALTTSNKTAHMAARGVRIPPFGKRSLDLTGFLGANNWLWRGWVDHRLRRQIFAPGRGASRPMRASEIAHLVMPVDSSVGADAVLRSGGRIPSAPTGMLLYERKPGQIPTGHVEAADGLRLVATPLKDNQFGYSAGRQGRGKSEQAMAEFLHYALVEGWCTVMVDPQAHAIERVKPFLVDCPKRVRVVAPGQPGPQASYNPLDFRGCDIEEVGYRVGELIAGIESSLGWGSRNNRALAILSLAFNSLAHISYLMCQHGRPDLQPTIFSMKPLLLDKTWRESLVPLLPAHLQFGWVNEFKSYSAEAVQVVVNLITRLRNRRSTAAFFGRSLSGFRFADSLVNNEIVLFSPEGLGDLTGLVANMLMFDIFGQIGRRSKAQADAHPCHVMADECQMYDSDTGELIPDGLRGGRKMRLYMRVANQELSALRPTTLSALLTNASQLFAYGTDKTSATRLSAELRGLVSAATIQGLPKYQFVAQIEVEGERVDPFLVHALQMEELFGDLMDESRVAALDAEITRLMDRQLVATTWGELATQDREIVAGVTGVLVRKQGPGKRGRPSAED